MNQLIKRFFLTFLFLTWSLIAPGFCYEIDELEFSLSNRGGNFNVGGNMTLSSMFGSTNFGFGTSHGAGGSSTNVYSTFTPPSMHQAAAMIGQTGVDPHQVPVQQNPLLMLHGFNARGIELLAQPISTHALPLVLLSPPALSAMAVVGGAIAAKIGIDGAKKALDARDRQSGAAACGGMPDPDSDDEGGNPQSASSKQKLREQLAREQQSKEDGKTIIDDKVWDRERIVSQYGGKAEEWVKKSSSSFQSDSNTKIQTHWIENIKTGQKVDMKVVDIPVKGVPNA